MKKRILSLVAALALAATVVAPVNATKFDPDYKMKDTNGAEAHLYGTSSSMATNKTLLDPDAPGATVTEKAATDAITDAATQVSSDNKDLKPSGAANAKVNVVTGAAKDNLMDNGIKPAVKEFVKATKKGEAGNGKCGIDKLRGIHYFNLTADQPGDVTFKVDDEYNSDAMTGDNYAIVLHYTGNAADEDGTTAQYCKISSAGKVTAHFNSYSPVGIIVTTATSAQQLVNTYSHSAGSDAGNAAATTTPAVTAPVVDPNAAVAAPVDGAAAAGTTAANGKGAASPKTSDNAYAMYLILAVAAVAGTTLVATKKTR